jgi:histidine triad (HIT) family protein
LSESNNCIFCKIIAGSIPSPKIYEDENLIGIRDIQPHAKAHFLIIPKKHIASLDEAFPVSGPTQSELLGSMFRAGTAVAREQGLLPNGFRATINTGEHGGQTVFHLHLHILGGGPLGARLA